MILCQEFVAIFSPIQFVTFQSKTYRCLSMQLLYSTLIRFSSYCYGSFISYLILKPKLHSFFRAWKVLWEKGRQLDTFYYHSTLSKAMNRWQHNIRAQKIVRMSGLRILYKRNKVLLKNVWQTWKT